MISSDERKALIFEFVEDLILNFQLQLACWEGEHPINIHKSCPMSMHEMFNISYVTWVIHIYDHCGFRYVGH